MENADVWSFKSPNNYLGVNEMSNMNDSVDNGNAGGDLAKKSISRRDMLKLVGVLGISGTVLGELLTSCGGSSPAADTMATDTVADLAAFDPMKYAGQTVRIMMTGDENDHRALGDQIAALEAETGIKVEITSPALGALIEKTLQNLQLRFCELVPLPRGFPHTQLQSVHHQVLSLSPQKHQQLSQRLQRHLQ